MNKAIIIGNLVADPELKHTNTGIPTMSVTVAVPRPYKASNGERDTDFFKVIIWRQSAEYVAKFGHKGNRIAIEGQMLHRKYTAQDGMERDVWELVAERAELYAPKDDVQKEYPQAERSKADAQVAYEEVEDDELPF